MNDRPILLEVTDLTVGYSTDDGTVVTLVDRVSFTLHEREVLCLVGESGSGKSLTMLAVLGLLPDGLEVLSGTVLFRGRDLGGLTPREWSALRGDELAMIFQDPMTALNPVKRVGTQIGRSVAAHNRGMSRKAVEARVESLLADVGVPDPGERAKSYPHEWSGGMRQRAVIAMAMANSPSVLVADEPTTALDVTIQAQIMKVLAGVRHQTEAAMILITHDLGLVAETADQICIMYAGRVVETGTVWDIFERPTHPYTAGLLASLLSSEHTGERVYAIPGQPPSPTSRGAGCPFASRCELPQKSEVCFTSRPPLAASGRSQYSACHFAEATSVFAEEVSA